MWLRGGFPDSYLAKSNEDSFKNRRRFTRFSLGYEFQSSAPKIRGAIFNFNRMLAEVIACACIIAFKSNAFLNVCFALGNTVN
ncbi:MAG: hypothetical protein ACOYNL_03545 [Rickettsiales bacterium]